MGNQVKIAKDRLKSLEAKEGRVDSLNKKIGELEDLHKKRMSDIFFYLDKNSKLDIDKVEELIGDNRELRDWIIMEGLHRSGCLVKDDIGCSCGFDEL